MKINTCGWYVECDAHTNEEIFRILAQKNIAEESICTGLLDGKGMSHDVIKLESYNNVRLLINSQPAGNYKFKIFFKPNGRTHLSEWTLHKFKKRPKVHLAIKN